MNDFISIQEWSETEEGISYLKSICKSLAEGIEEDILKESKMNDFTKEELAKPTSKKK